MKISILMVCHSTWSRLHISNFPSGSMHPTSGLRGVGNCWLYFSAMHFICKTLNVLISFYALNICMYRSFTDKFNKKGKVVEWKRDPKDRSPVPGRKTGERSNININKWEHFLKKIEKQISSRLPLYDIVNY